MKNLLKIFSIICSFICFFVVNSCAQKNSELNKTTKSRSAQDRINSAESNSNSLTKELDN